MIGLGNIFSVQFLYTVGILLLYHYYDSALFMFVTNTY